MVVAVDVFSEAVEEDDDAFGGGGGLLVHVNVILVNYFPGL